MGGAVALGAVFHEVVEALLTTLEDLGHLAIAMLILAVALFIATSGGSATGSCGRSDDANHDGPACADGSMPGIVLLGEKHEVVHRPGGLRQHPSPRHLI
jgi:hypothetical protein